MRMNYLALAQEFGNEHFRGMLPKERVYCALILFYGLRLFDGLDSWSDTSEVFTETMKRIDINFSDASQGLQRLWELGIVEQRSLNKRTRWRLRLVHSIEASAHMKRLVRALCDTREAVLSMSN